MFAALRSAKGARRDSPARSITLGDLRAELLALGDGLHSIFVDGQPTKSTDTQPYLRPDSYGRPQQGVRRGYRSFDLIRGGDCQLVRRLLGKTLPWSREHLRSTRVLTRGLPPWEGPSYRATTGFASYFVTTTSEKTTSWQRFLTLL